MEFTESEIHTAQAAHKDRLYLAKYLESPHGLAAVFNLMHVDPSHATPGQWGACRILRKNMVHAVTHAPSIAVPDLTCQLVHAHSPTYPDTRVDSGDVEFPYGFAWFERPIADPHTPDDVYPLRAVLWWTHPASDVPGLVGDHHLMTIVGMCDTKTIDGVDQPALSSLPRVMPCVSTMWELDTDDGGMPNDIADTDPRRSYVRSLLTLWAVIGQRLADVDPVRQVMTRQYSHYARKSEFKINDALRLVRISPANRATHGYVGSNRVEWAWQWWVRAFWRNQWYPSTGRNKPKLILPYLKGDPDKPTKGEHRIYLPPQEM